MLNHAFDVAPHRCNKRLVRPGSIIDYPTSAGSTLVSQVNNHCRLELDYATLKHDISVSILQPLPDSQPRLPRQS